MSIIIEEVEEDLIDHAAAVYYMIGGTDGLAQLLADFPEGDVPIETMRAHMVHLAEKNTHICGMLIGLGLAFLTGLDPRVFTHARTLVPIVDPMAPTQCPECKHFGHHADSCTLHARFTEALRRGKA